MNKTSKYTGTQSQPASATAIPTFHRNLGVQAKHDAKTNSNLILILILTNT